MITIKNRFTNDTIFECDLENLRGAYLRGAYLRDADLRGADLQDANLQDANLRCADLQDANLRGANLRCADLQYTNLQYTNLRGADLRGADLRGADLRGADLDGERLSVNPLVVGGLRYWCLISDNYMQLGCKRFTHDEWTAFSDDEISNMDSYALEFWKQWKAPLLAMCAAHRGGV